MSIKQTVTLLRKDLTNALRDNLVLYMFVAPVLLALGARFLLPSLEETKLTFAVEESLGTELVAKLESLGDVELFESREEVLERVQRNDDVPGIVVEDSGYVVYLEGNEPEGEQLATIIMSGVLNEGEVATFVHEELQASRSLLGEYAAVVLVMLAVMMGALIMGFLMVDEKESKVLNALAEAVQEALARLG